MNYTSLIFPGIRLANFAVRDGWGNRGVLTCSRHSRPHSSDNSSVRKRITLFL